MSNKEKEIKKRIKYLESEIKSVYRIWNFLTPVQQKRYENFGEELDKLKEKTND